VSPVAKQRVRDFFQYVPPLVLLVVAVNWGEWRQGVESDILRNTENIAEIVVNDSARDQKIDTLRRELSDIQAGYRERGAIIASMQTVMNQTCTKIDQIYTWMIEDRRGE
jgi:hypothetical protein